MPILESYKKEVEENLKEENKVSLYYSPHDEIPFEIPEIWNEALKEKDPREIIIEKLWAPMKPFLPKTLELFKTSLQGIGLAKSNEEPLSLLYFFSDEGDPAIYRGFLPKPLERSEAQKLPKPFLDFYTIHNGWLDLSSLCFGPKRIETWDYLSDVYDEEAQETVRSEFDPENFLILYDHMNPWVGMDLGKTPPIPFVIWDHDPPEMVPNLMETLDDYILNSMDAPDPVK